MRNLQSIDINMTKMADGKRWLATVTRTSYDAEPPAGMSRYSTDTTHADVYQDVDVIDMARDLLQHHTNGVEEPKVLSINVSLKTEEGCS